MKPLQLKLKNILRRATDLFGLGIVAIAAVLVYQLYTDIAHEKLFAENHRLRQLLDQSGVELDLVEERMEFLQNQDRELRSFAELDSISSDVRAMGVGGAVPTAWTPDNDDNLLLLDQLDRELGLLEFSMSEVRTAVESRVEELKHIPSMRPVRDGMISSGYGRRPDPFTKRKRMHKGVDFQAPRGTEIYAPADGRVTVAGWMRGFGRVIKVDHGNGIETLYGHLHRTKVKIGQNVTRGDLLGLVGSSGRSTSSHLHYEVRVDGRHRNPVDYFITDDMAWED